MPRHSWNDRPYRTALRTVTLAAGAAALAGVLGSCDRKAAGGAPLPPQVTMLTVQTHTIPSGTVWVAEAAASKSVQVRAQVSGVIVERPYIEGTDVRKGAVLYRIDPRTCEANYQSAQARLAENEAQLANAGTCSRRVLASMVSSQD